MMKRRVLIAALVLVSCERLHSQISPGELSRAHQHLEGINNCTQCHERGEATTDAKCLGCHEEIRDARETKHGLHFQRSSASCTTCHKEHLGRDGRTTRFDRTAFEHTVTGFALKGGHAKLRCEQCHAAGNIKNAVVQKSLRAHPRATLLGLHRACSACHQDKHSGSLGTKCESCHTETGWKPASLFVHTVAKFPLAEKHANVACDQCHKTFRERAPNQPLRFAVKDFADCKSCHVSPHSEKFSQQHCQSCHTTGGWSAAQNFNHAVTAFPLHGKHVQVACEKCHTSLSARADKEKLDFGTRAFGDCTPCHTSPHASSFSKKSCVSCHTPSGWKTVSSKLFDHTMTAFPLEGRHASVKCGQCHRQKAAEVLKPGTSCIGCHEDIHRGEFARSHQNDCARCHSTQSFRPASFGVADHSGSRFALTGAHAATVCRTCHWKEGRSNFRFESIACTACHVDKHRGQFASTMNERSCAACHTTQSWEMRSFDHARTGFTITGKHSTVGCEGCHRRDETSAAVVYKDTPQSCNGCHSDPHAGQFALNGSTDCSRCHTPAGWHTLAFQHQSQSAFPLTGAHKNIDCARCHKPEEHQGKRVVRYKPISTQCESCHQQGVGK